MEQITKNFTLSEFAASAMANAKGIDNTMPADVIPRVRMLATRLLQPLIDFVGTKLPGATVHDRITSGYRCDVLNKVVGGVPSSMHRTGEASDNQFYIRRSGSLFDLAPLEVLRYLVESGLDFDQAIVYPTFIHLSYTAQRVNRRQVLYNKSYVGPKFGRV